MPLRILCSFKLVDIGIYFLYFHVLFEQNMGGFEKIGSLGRLQNGGGH